jgi:signal transduction histidine kinase
MRRFLADASHELRTPIAALQASAETLLREQPPRPERDALEARLARDAARLGRLVDDLLDLARLEGGAAAARDAVDLASVACSALEAAGTREAGVRVSLSLGERATVDGDAGALERAVRNLLDNAAAAAPGGNVELAVRRCDDVVELSVADDGPGVPAGEHERVFERFVRLGQTAGRSGGLGLAIARRIARQHGGDLTCDDVPRGARFTLRLPPRSEAPLAAI